MMVGDHTTLQMCRKCHDECKTFLAYLMRLMCDATDIGYLLRKKMLLKKIFVS